MKFVSLQIFDTILVHYQNFRSASLKVRKLESQFITWENLSMAARQILSRAVEFINQIDDFLDALNMAQFLQRIFAKPLKLSKTILDL